MSAIYWTVEDGQLQAGEILDSGHLHRNDAKKSAEAIERKYHLAVRRLKTIESDYPIGDPRYEPFPSARWCVIVRE